MKLLLTLKFFLVLVACSLFASFSMAQGVILPQVSQKVSTTQTVGLSEVNITYSAPKVSEREIWGGIVPMEQVWRAGANENTTISFSHDAKINGKSIKAGTYGLHMLPGKDSWQVIFSSNSTSWGSYSYTDKEDVLRVEVKPEEHAFTEVLNYHFTQPGAESVTVNLSWEKLNIPFEVSFDTHEIVLASLRNQLRSTAGFTWMGYQQAANYCLQNEINYEEALTWIDQSITGGFGAQANFTNVSTKAQLLEKMGRTDDAKTAWAKAMEVGNELELYSYGAGLIGQGKNEQAFEVFKANHKRFGDTWLSFAGLAAGNRVNGNNKEALKYYRKAHEGAPDQWKASLEGRIKQMEEAVR